MQIAEGKAPVIISGERANRYSITMFEAASNLCLNTMYMSVTRRRIFTAIGDIESLMEAFNEHLLKIEIPQSRDPVQAKKHYCDRFLDSQPVRSLCLLGVDIDGRPIAFPERTADELDAVQVKFSERINRLGGGIISPVQDRRNRAYYLTSEAYRYFHTNEERAQYAVPAIVDEIYMNDVVPNMGGMLEIFQCWGFKIERNSELAKKIHEIMFWDRQRHSIHDFLDDADAAAFLLKQELEKKNRGYPSADFN